MEKDSLKTDILKKEVVKIFKKFGLNNNHALISANAFLVHDPVWINEMGPVCPKYIGTDENWVVAPPCKNKTE